MRSFLNKSSNIRAERVWEQTLVVSCVTNLLRGVDDTDVVAELEHAEHGREYGQHERAGQPLRRTE